MWPTHRRPFEWDGRGECASDEPCLDKVHPDSYPLIGIDGFVPSLAAVRARCVAEWNCPALGGCASRSDGRSGTGGGRGRSSGRSLSAPRRGSVAAVHLNRSPVSDVVHGAGGDKRRMPAIWAPSPELAASW